MAAVQGTSYNLTTKRVFCEVVRWRRGADETRLSWLPATCVGLQAQRTTRSFCVNNVGHFCATNKVDTSLYIFPNSAQNCFHFSLKLPAVCVGDCLSSLAGWDRTARERKKKGLGVCGVGRAILLMYVIQSPKDGQMCGRERQVPYISAP